MIHTFEETEQERINREKMIRDLFWAFQRAALLAIPVIIIFVYYFLKWGVSISRIVEIILLCLAFIEVPAFLAWFLLKYSICIIISDESIEKRSFFSGHKLKWKNVKSVTLTHQNSRHDPDTLILAFSVRFPYKEMKLYLIESEKLEKIIQLINKYSGLELTES